MLCELPVQVCGTLALLSGADCLAGFETEPSDATPFHGVNKWPSEEDLPGFRDTMEEYHKEMSCIANRFPALISCMSMARVMCTFGSCMSQC